MKKFAVVVTPEAQAAITESFLYINKRAGSVERGAVVEATIFANRYVGTISGEVCIRTGA